MSYIFHISIHLIAFTHRFVCVGSPLLQSLTLHLFQLLSNPLAFRWRAHTHKYYFVCFVHFSRATSSSNSFFGGELMSLGCVRCTYMRFTSTKPAFPAYVFSSYKRRHDCFTVFYSCVLQYVGILEAYRTHEPWPSFMHSAKPHRHTHTHLQERNSL